MKPGKIEYIPPTSDEFRSLLKRWGDMYNEPGKNLTGAQAAELVGFKSGRAIRKYTGGVADVSYAVLFTLFAKVEGRFVPLNWRDDLWG